jgi:3-methyladenine DNA glycosylase AlkD
MDRINAIIGDLHSQANEDHLKRMEHFRIDAKNIIGVRIPKLRAMAKSIGTNHEIALGLWDSKIHEARILAAFVDDPAKVSEVQMEDWAKDFDSWDICDQCCGSLFDRTEFAYRKANEWPERDEEYIKRAGFSLMAALAVHNKRMPDSYFLKLLPIIERESDDDRNFVRKAVNWALRQIGKRNERLNKAALICAERIVKRNSKSARWIARDAIRELKSHAVQKRLGVI